MPESTEYLVLTEATLPRLLVRALFKRPTCLVAVRSFLSGVDDGVLGRLASRLRAKGRLIDLDHDHAADLTYRNDIRLIMAEDAFATNESAVERTFAFAVSDERFGRYGLAYRHAVCSRALARLRLMHRIADVSRFANPDRDRIVGLGPEDVALFRARFGRVPPLPISGGLRIRGLIATLITCLSIATGLAWLVTTIRPSRTSPRKFLLASDFINDGRDLQLWQEVADDPSAIMVVFRNRELAREGAKLAAGWPSCVRTDGRFTPAAGLRAMVELVADSCFLFWRGRSLPLDIFRTLAPLPYKRMVFRGLFNRYRFQFFWDRSDYNSEHIMCSQELRATGGQPLGLMHGIPSICNVMPQLRHLDYDIYYCMSRHQYLNYYRAKWSPSMRVRFIGSFGLTREEHHRLTLPRRRDIVFFVVSATHGVAGLEVVDKLATAFPERRIYVSAKRKFDSGAYGAAMAALEERHRNVRIHRGRSYELLFECNYAFSQGSTLAAEAAQAGLYSFTLDLDIEQWKVNFYRAFPGMCLHSAEDVIERIRAIEAGTWTYPRHLYGGMIEMSGRIFYDIVREDLGLPTKDEVLPHLAFVPDEGHRRQLAMT